MSIDSFINSSKYTYALMMRPIGKRIANTQPML